MIEMDAMAKKKSDALCVESILKDFSDLPDPRSDINRRHLLGDIIVISIMVAF